MNWKRATWLFIDSETTGTDPEEARIVELGAVKVRDGEILERRGMVVDPGVPIPDEAAQIHGITGDLVKGRPALQSIGARFLDHVRAADVLGAYNAPYDFRILERELGQPWRDAIEGKPVLDPLVICRFEHVGRYWRGKGRHRLTSVCERFGLRIEGQAHRASTDAAMAARVLWRLRCHLPEDAYEASQLIAEQREIQDADFRAYMRRKGGARRP